MEKETDNLYIQDIMKPKKAKEIAKCKKDAVVICYATVDQKVKDILDRPGITLYENVTRDELQGILSEHPQLLPTIDWGIKILNATDFDKLFDEFDFLKRI